MAMWKVITLWTEDEDVLEGEPEYTSVVEKEFEDYYKMQEYVSASVSNGCVDGMVLKYDTNKGIWWYYMEVC